MQTGKTRIIFDTSGLNKLKKDDRNQQALLEKLGVQCEVLISETSVVELSATKKPEDRKQLLDLCERLLPFGGCLMPHNWILEETPRLNTRYKGRFRWEDVDITAPKIEREILQREFLDQDSMAEESWQFARTQNKRFIDIFREAREKFEAQFTEDIENLTLAEFIDMYKAANGPFWGLVIGFYERARWLRLTEAEAREFIVRCPPFHAAALGIVVAHYQYGLPRNNRKAEYDAGRNDLFMAVYLPYCDWFITDDTGQQNALTAIANEVGVGVRILGYTEFCRELLSEGAEGATAWLARSTKSTASSPPSGSQP